MFKIYEIHVVMIWPGQVLDDFGVQTLQENYLACMSDSPSLKALQTFQIIFENVILTAC